MNDSILDTEGYRLNVGMVLLNTHGQVLLAERQDLPTAWQFPQGGLQSNETVEQGLYRELEEELGLLASDVICLAKTRNWITYRFPKEFHRFDQNIPCIGQKQQWFLLKLISDENHIQLNRSDSPELIAWKWVDYWYPLEVIAPFKRAVYEAVLNEFASLGNQKL